MREEYIGENSPAVLSLAHTRGNVTLEELKCKRIRYCDVGVEATFLEMTSKGIREGDKAFYPWHRVDSIAPMD
jgi:hypothetical protein